MIYIDTSVVLAKLFVEDRRPSDEFWDEPLTSSRLLLYEMWARVNARGFTASRRENVRELLTRVSFVEMTAPVLDRALDPLPVSLRTLDAMHLATADFLKQQGLPVRLASYDRRLVSAAQAMGFETVPL